MKALLPDGTELELEQGATGADAARAIGAGLARAALGIRVDEGSATLDAPLEDGARIEIVTDRDEDGLWLIRHDAAHVLATAVLELYPGVKISIWPADRGRLLLRLRLPRRRDPLRRRLRAHRGEDARAHQGGRALRARGRDRRGGARPFQGEGQDYKVELIEDLVRDADPPTRSRRSRSTERPLHRPLPRPARPRHEAGQGLQAHQPRGRVLARRRQPPDAHARVLDCLAVQGAARGAPEADRGGRARDHRKLGRELDLFMLSELSPGSPSGYRRHAHLGNELTAPVRTTNVDRGYQEVRTPILYDVELWKQSGHWHVYRDRYFTDVEDKPMGLKPMNCPAHVQIYKRDLHSYRDLPDPLRRAGARAPSRAERHPPRPAAGALHHAGRRPRVLPRDQIEEEVVRCLDFGFYIYDHFGLKPRLELSTRPEKRVGTDEMWDKAEAALQQALENQGLEYELNEGDGAFYGPKIDLRMTDASGAVARHGPVRLLHAGAVRAHLHGRGQPGAPPGHDPPRPDGRLRAAIGILIEHYGGEFPLWLAPVQARVLPIADRRGVRARWRASSRWREHPVEVDDRTESVGKKIETGS